MIYLFLLAHLVADFVLQPFWLVMRKRHWDGLLIHGGVVLMCMLLLPLIDPGTLRLWPAMLVTTAMHVLADWWKVHHGDQILPSALVAFVLDQVIHIVTLGAVLTIALPAEAVWAVQASPVGYAALYAGVYVIAAFATPIGVMIWLDPTFTHAALAGAARFRSFIVSAAAISLVLAGGTLALPPILIGVAIAIRRPASPHPLDTPFGLLANLCVAVTLGTMLMIVPG